jgi:hypothetical protein
MNIGKHSLDKHDIEYGFFIVFATLVYVMVEIVFI